MTAKTNNDDNDNDESTTRRFDATMQLTVGGFAGLQVCRFLMSNENS